MSSSTTVSTTEGSDLPLSMLDLSVWSKRLARPPFGSDQREAQRLFEAAVRAHLSGRTDDAVALYRQALFVRPDYAEAHNNMAVALVTQGKLDEAVDTYGRAITLKPNYAEAHNNLAVALVAQGRVAEAMRCYSRLLVQDPKNANVHYNIGLAYAAQGKLNEAAASYGDALSYEPDHTEAHNNLGNVLASAGKLDDALAHYERALALNSNHAAAHNNLANLLRDQGKFSEAVAHYDQAIAARPSTAEAHYNRSDIKTFHSDDGDLALLEELASRDDLPAKQKPFVHFAFAKALDDAGDYQRSFEHLHIGNQLKRAQVVYDEAATTTLFERMAGAFAPDVFQRLQVRGDESASPIFIVGMPRSGTTLIEQILASHPQVHGAGEIGNLETAAGHLLAAPITELDSTALQSAGEAYMASLPALTDGKTRVVNKLPQNFFYLGLIRLVLPNARIIHITRDPVGTCMSCYSKLFTAGQNYSYDLEELGRYYKQYERLMDHWRCALPPGSMLEVSYEDVVNDLELQARRLLAFCNLPWDDRCIHFHRTNRPVHTASAVQVRQPLFRTSLTRWRKYDSAIALLLRELNQK